MPEFTVYFETVASSSVRVDAEDDQDAIDAAYEKLPSSVCAQCSGWGRKAGIDLGGEWEPTAVVDANNEEVWSQVL